MPSNEQPLGSNSNYSDPGDTYFNARGYALEFYHVPSGNVEGFTVFAKGVVGLGVAFAAFGALAPVIAVGATAIAASLTGVALAARGANMVAEPMMNFFETLGDLASSTGLSQVARDIVEIAQAVESLPQEKSIAFKGVVDSISGLEQANGNIATTRAASAAQSTARTVFAATQNNNTNNQQSAPIERQPIEIKLMLEDREMASYVLEVVGRELDITRI